MDIYEQAKKDNADYYDPFSGYIYKIQEYNRIKENGLPPYPGIRIFDVYGNFIGYAMKK